ncbi:cytochrome c oxidase subunit II [Phenylobacterium sp.]|uniref:cytochrome c oxidase subunit II n=1 Tax=Phenylobacterium sp. TaxID=1871053 RepID=UPI00351E242F
MGPILLLGGCEAPLSTLAPAGEAAHVIALLWWVMLAGAVVIFVGVVGAALLPLVTRRLGPPSERVMLVGGGLVFPGVVLLALLVAALIIGDRLSPRGEPDVLRIEAEAHRWAWTFRYPDQPGAPSTEGVLHVPAGRPFEVHVTSRDVIHSFWAPRLGGKIDAIPGHVNVIRLQADAPGVYRGQCAEFCGGGHAAMGFVLHAHSAEDYGAWMADASPAPGVSQ